MDEALEEHTVGALEDHEARLVGLERQHIAIAGVQKMVEVLAVDLEKQAVATNEHLARLEQLEQLVPRLEAQLRRGAWRIATIASVAGVLVGSCGSCGTKRAREDDSALHAARVNEANARRQADEAQDACERLALRYDEPIASCH